MNITIDNIGQISELKGKNTAIPHCPVENQAFSGTAIGFLDKTHDRKYSVSFFFEIGYDITKFRRRLSRGYPHQYQIGSTLRCDLSHLPDSMEVALFGIRIDRHHNNNFVAIAMLLFK